MPSYRYVIHNVGEVAPASADYELASDHESMMLAFFVIGDHPRCHEIEIWDGDRRVTAQDPLEQILLQTPQRSGLPQ